MAHTLYDGIGDQTSTVGTADFVIDSVALTGCNSISSRVADGVSLGYRCQDSTNANWEIGTGTWTAATNTLTRTTIAASSNAGAKVNFPSGAKAIALVTQAVDFVADVASATHAATGKTTPVDADELPIADSAASFGLKKLTWANLKATAKTYFDALYQAVLVSGTNIKTINSSSLLGSGDLAISGMNLGANTFTAAQDIDFATTANTSADGLNLVTTATASSGNQMFSPRVRWKGFGWKTTATAASQAVEFIAEVQPVQGAANPTGIWKLRSSINGGAYADAMTTDTSGNLVAAGSISFGGNSQSISSTSSTLATLNNARWVATGFRNADSAAAIDTQGGFVGMYVGTGNGYYYSSTSNWFGTVDLGRTRSAAGLEEINNGTTGTFRDLKLRGVWFGSTLTVGTLPSAASSEGLIYRVSDSSAPAVGSTVSAGGSAKCTVQSDATNWKVIWIA